MSTVIKIENLYKEYRLGVIGHGTIYRDLQSWWAKTRGKPDPNSLLGVANPNQGKDRILAINDISLEINDGEVLGIIGANGAGKSTLLKILSKVTAPTSGTIKYKGRIASLLEVGTGFHPELTGRENIYLNGAINGMNNKEVTHKLEEIVDFSGVGQFLDTPVKRYSTGMHVRLGFAVAAYLDQEILVVDEVLAVGDASFQKKAIAKINEVSKGEGRTVLFVSHNMDSIKQLCTSSVLLKEGKVINQGPTKMVIDSYLSLAVSKVKEYDGQRTWELDDAPGNDVLRLIAIRTTNKKGEIQSNFDVTEPIQIEVDYEVFEGEHQLASGFHLHNDRGDWLFFAPDDYFQGPWGKQPCKSIGTHRVVYTINGNLLTDGVFSLHAFMYEPPMAPVSDHNLFYDVTDALSFKVIDTFNKDGVRGNFPFSWGTPAVRPKIECKSYLLFPK